MRYITVFCGRYRLATGTRAIACFYIVSTSKQLIFFDCKHVYTMRPYFMCKPGALTTRNTPCRGHNWSLFGHKKTKLRDEISEPYEVRSVELCVCWFISTKMIQMKSRRQVLLDAQHSVEIHFFLKKSFIFQCRGSPFRKLLHCRGLLNATQVFTLIWILIHFI